MKNKRGSLNLSIEAIVIVVIAFVVLGLGLGFIRGQFKSITETSSGVQEQIRSQILEDLRTGDKKLSFPATTLNIDAKDSQDIAIGVKNTLSAGDLKFTIKLETTQKQGETPTAGQTIDDIQFFYDPGPFTLQQTEAEAYNIKLTAAGAKGTYLVKLQIWDEADAVTPYAEKTFFVNII